MPTRVPDSKCTTVITCTYSRSFRAMASDHAHGSAVRTVAVAAGAAVLAAGIMSASWSGYVPTSTDRAKAVVRLLREQLHAWTQAWAGHEQVRGMERGMQGTLVMLAHHVA